MGQAMESQRYWSADHHAQTAFRISAGLKEGFKAYLVRTEGMAEAESNSALKNVQTILMDHFHGPSKVPNLQTAEDVLQLPKMESKSIRGVLPW